MKKFLILIGFFLYNMLPIKAQDNISDTEVNGRLGYIQNALEKDKHSDKIWWNSWLIGYSTATIAQVGAGLTANELSLRQDMYLGAAATGLGAGFLLLTPINKIEDKYFNENNVLTSEERMKLLFEAEKELEKSAQYEMDVRSWKNHALTGAVNVGSGLITWLAFDRALQDGLLNFALNSIITEAQIWTISIHAKKARDAYEAKYKSGLTTYGPKPRMNFTVAAIPNGFTLQVIF